MDTAYPPVHQSPLPQPVPAGSMPPVSVGWESCDKRLIRASMLPAPYFIPPSSPYTGCPEAALMQAVLDDALACFQRQDETEQRWVQREARQAAEWLFCDDAHELFSYVSVCAVLGVEPESIRQELMRWSPSPPEPAAAQSSDIGIPRLSTHGTRGRVGTRMGQPRRGRCRGGRCLAGLGSVRAVRQEATPLARCVAGHASHDR
jgi:hypothetical protein